MRCKKAKHVVCLNPVRPMVHNSCPITSNSCLCAWIRVCCGQELSVGWLASLVWLWLAAATAEGLLKRPAWPGMSVEGREIRAKKYGKKDDEFSSLRVDVWIHELSCPQLAFSTLCASKTWFSCCRLLSVRANYCVFGRPRLVSGLRVYVSMIRLVRQRSSTAKLQIVSGDTVSISSPNFSSMNPSKPSAGGYPLNGPCGQLSMQMRDCWTPSL